MAWVRFSEPFGWTPKGRPTVEVRYRAGRAYSVPTACWLAARAAGSAIRIKAPRRGEDPNAVRHGANPEGAHAGRG